MVKPLPVLFMILSAAGSCDRETKVSVNDEPTTDALPVPEPFPALVTINGDAGYTNNREVTLFLDAQGPKTMYISQVGCSSGGVWEPFIEHKTLSLDVESDGEVRVYALYKNEKNFASQCASDSIIFDSTPPSPPSDISASVTSPTNQQNITVTGKVPEENPSVRIFSDAACQQALGTVDGGPFQESGLQISLTKEASNTLYLYTFDEAGNTSECTSGPVMVHDSISPSITSISFVSDQTTYGTGDRISIVIKFNEDLKITGAPILKLGFINGTGEAAYNADADDDPSQMTFEYTVTATDQASELDVASENALSIPDGAAITDLAQNAATVSLPIAGDDDALSTKTKVYVNTTAN